MKILVPVKRVIDAYVRIRIKRDESDVETQGVKMSMNPFCEIAVEEAVRLKESGIASEVIILSCGADEVQETIRAGLAIGGDRGIHIHVPDTLPTPLILAKLIYEVTLREQPDIILAGKQSIDGDHNQTGQMLAGLLGWAQGTFISELEIDQNTGEAIVTREIDGGLETLALALPAVLTTDLRLNEPRYPKLPNIMKAKSKPMEIIDAQSLAVDMTPRQNILKITAPPQRKAGRILGSVDDLAEVITNSVQ